MRFRLAGFPTNAYWEPVDEEAKEWLADCDIDPRVERIRELPLSSWTVDVGTEVEVIGSTSTTIERRCLMTANDPAAIARGLSNAQANMLESLFRGHVRFEGRLPKEVFDLRSQGLATLSFFEGNGKIWCTIFITPLGVAVREEIQQEKGRV